MHMNENNTTKTPLTDALADRIGGYGHRFQLSKWKHHARQLERRCAELEEENAKLRDLAERRLSHIKTGIKQNAELRRDRERLRGMLSDEVLISDDYGVQGSTFYICPYCHNESGAGVLNQGIEHDDGCPLKPDAAIRGSRTGNASGEQTLPR